jgi:hypothetical protein
MRLHGGISFRFSNHPTVSGDTFNNGSATEFLICPSFQCSLSLPQLPDSASGAPRYGTALLFNSLRNKTKDAARLVFPLLLATARAPISYSDYPIQSSCAPSFIPLVAERRGIKHLLCHGLALGPNECPYPAGWREMVKTSHHCGLEVASAR